MDEQTGAEVAHAALRETVIEAHPQEAASLRAETELAAAPGTRQRTVAAGPPAVPDVAELDAPQASATRLRSNAASAPSTQSRRLSAAQPGGGSAGSEFEVDPEQYRAAVGPVLAAADQLSQLVTGLTAFLEHTQSTAPWGNDDSGKKFAQGEKGYLKYSADTLKTLKSMPDEVKYIADGLKAMAENFRAAEEGNTSAFQGGDGSDGVSVPQTGSYSAPVDVLPPSAVLRNIAQSGPSTYRRA